MAISAALVKELRERTGAGMMECKKALADANGDIEAAIESMRISGQAKAAKKAGRIAAEGIISIAREGKRVVMIEINCETDFVTKGEDFQNFCQTVTQSLLQQHPDNLESLLEIPLPGGKTIEETRKDLIAKIGENINARRFTSYDSQGGTLGVYLHGARIGVLVDMQGGDETLAKDIAMHIAASRPACVNASEVPAELIAKERTIYAAQAAESGKPANIIEKMVDGRIKKFLTEITLLGQAFVKNPDQTVEKLLAENKATVLRFQRFEVGEGLEKKSGNFAEEVMQQAGLKA